MLKKTLSITFLSAFLFAGLGSEFASGEGRTHGQEVPSGNSERPPVILAQGEQRLITVPGLKRFSLGSPILRTLASPGGNKDLILMKAVSPGLTDLWVWKTDGSREHRSIEVRAWKKGPLTDLEKRLSDLREVEIWIGGTPETGKVTYTVQGLITTLAEAKRVGDLLAAFPTELLNQVTFSDSLYREGEKGLRAWLAKSSYKDDIELLAEPATKTLVVRGGLPDSTLRAGVEKSLREIFPLTRLEIDSMPDRNPTIHFKVFLLELRKNRSRALGVDFPGVFPNALRISHLGIHTALSIEAAIQALENDGSARVLSQPELVVRAPGEAELFAGGEIPIQSKTVYSSRVEWRSYGLSLKLKVHGASGRKVRADIQTEVSHLDGAATDDHIPGLQANRMKTQVDATFGQPLLLSGLLQEGVKKAAKGLPFLKDIPVLGLLFGSSDYLEDRSELVAVLLPSRTLPEAPRAALEIDRPVGNVPLSRNWISPSEEIALRNTKEFPWNAFEDSPLESPTEGIPFGETHSADSHLAVEAFQP
ncbi:MAG: type II and III secretion system protein [Cryobacterium sp.]|nr:type II and III secretion system protein [Oligoflexia bacterium]